MYIKKAQFNKKNFLLNFKLDNESEPEVEP